MKQNKVAVNLNQDFTEEEQSTARNNIGAASEENLNSLQGSLRIQAERVNSLYQKESWKEVDIDPLKRNPSEKNVIVYLGNDGHIGYYFDNSSSLSLTWYDDTSANFKMWSNDGYTEINGAGPIPLNAKFYNGNGQHNTLRWKLNSFRCIDFHFNPDTKKLYWKEL